MSKIRLLHVATSVALFFLLLFIFSCGKDVDVILSSENTLGFSQDERLKSMLDTVVIELVENGQMDKILDKYDPDQKMLMRLKRPGHP